MNLLRLIPIRYREIVRGLNNQQRAAIFEKTELKFKKIFKQTDLDKFSQITGDFNYIHSTAIPQEQRKVHGALLNAVVAGVIGTKFPGAGTIVLEQTFSFPKPCRIEVDCEFSLKLLQERKISIISYECRQNNEIVFQGKAKLLITGQK